MMTVNLHLICLIVIMALVHVSGVVNILSVFIPYVFHEDRGWVWPISHFIDVITKVIYQILVPFLEEVLLIVNNYS